MEVNNEIVKTNFRNAWKKKQLKQNKTNILKYGQALTDIQK